MRKLQATSYKLQANLGFTLIEILVVVGIVGLVSYLVIIPFASFRDETLLDAAAEETLALLHEARGRTVSSDGAPQYGVHFESDKMTLLPDNKEVLLPNRLIISNISLAEGATTVTFKRLTGATDQGGTVTISLVSDNSRQRIIAISSAGGVGLK